MARSHFYRLIFFLLLLGVSSVIALAKPPVSIPEGKSVMIDGKLSPGEWDDAVRLDLDRRGSQLLVKFHEDFLLIAVVAAPREGLDSFADLYINSDSGNTIDLHASAKLGERELRKGHWSDWIWWNNRDWSANVARVASFEEKRFLSEDVREFQIRRSRFSGKRLLLRVEISTAHGATYKEEYFPQGSSAKETSSWYELRF